MKIVKKSALILVLAFVFSLTLSLSALADSSGSEGSDLESSGSDISKSESSKESSGESSGTVADFSGEAAKQARFLMVWEGKVSAMAAYATRKGMDGVYLVDGGAEAKNVAAANGDKLEIHIFYRNDVSVESITAELEGLSDIKISSVVVRAEVFSIEDLAELKTILAEKKIGFGIWTSESLGPSIGMSTKPSAYVARDLSGLLAIEADYIMPMMDRELSAGGGAADFRYYFEENAKFAEESGIELRPCIGLGSGSGTETADKYEMMAQIVMAKSGLYPAIVIEGAEAILDEESGYALSFNALLFKNAGPNLEQTAGFYITRPSGEITAKTSTYYILGQADPAKDLFCDDEKVEDRGELGSFGYFVELKKGINKFSFYQTGGVDLTVVINYQPDDGKPATISKVSKTGAWPLGDTVIREGESASLKCIAPSGEEVYAVVGEERITLKQAATAADGIAVSYTGSFMPTGKKDAGTQKYSRVEYYILGIAEPVTSAGMLYRAEEDGAVLLRSSRTLVSIYETPAGVANYEYSGVYGEGVIDELVGYSEGMIELASGGFVKKEDMTILEGENEASISIVWDIEMSGNKSSATVIFSGLSDVPTRIKDVGNGSYTLQVYNSSLGEEVATKLSKMSELSAFMNVSLISKSETEFFLTIKVREGFNISGYSVDFVDGNMIVSFRKAVRTNAGGRLDGVCVLIDAGHGGVDPGALGAYGEKSPAEKDLALAIALETKQQLEALGATVYMIRDGDYFIELYDRAAINERIQPDFFISVHLNSMPESSDGIKGDGTEIYYYNEASINFAENMLTSVTETIPRKSRGVIEGAYVIARPASNPSLLCELGFMPNPVQFDQMLDEETIRLTAAGLVKGIVATAEGG